MHSPGPWEIDHHKMDNGCFSVLSRELSIVADVHELDFDEDRHKDAFDVHREMEANARLIAASPNLLAALQAALSDPSDDATTEMCQKAVAEATGEAINP